MVFGRGRDGRCGRSRGSGRASFDRASAGRRAAGLHRRRRGGDVRTWGRERLGLLRVVLGHFERRKLSIGTVLAPTAGGAGTAAQCRTGVRHRPPRHASSAIAAGERPGRRRAAGRGGATGRRRRGRRRRPPPVPVHQRDDRLQAAADRPFPCAVSAAPGGRPTVTRRLRHPRRASQTLPVCAVQQGWDGSTVAGGTAAVVVDTRRLRSSGCRTGRGRTIAPTAAWQRHAPCA